MHRVYLPKTFREYLVLIELIFLSQPIAVVRISIHSVWIGIQHLQKKNSDPWLVKSFLFVFLLTISYC
jgi:hypothetical protein